MERVRPFPDAGNHPYRRCHRDGYDRYPGHHGLPAPTRSGCFIASSNGLASGNYFPEALSHAICETVERGEGRGGEAGSRGWPGLIWDKRGWGGRDGG
jgi:YcaO cyclodehydratase, ATP-ad Mg2+-binding